MVVRVRCREGSGRWLACQPPAQFSLPCKHFLPTFSSPFSRPPLTFISSSTSATLLTVTFHLLPVGFREPGKGGGGECKIERRRKESQWWRQREKRRKGEEKGGEGEGGESGRIAKRARATRSKGSLSELLSRRQPLRLVTCR